ASTPWRRPTARRGNHRAAAGEHWGPGHVRGPDARTRRPDQRLPHRLPCTPRTAPGGHPAATAPRDADRTSACRPRGQCGLPRGIRPAWRDVLSEAERERLVTAAVERLTT